MENNHLAIIESVAVRIRAFVESNPEILNMLPKDLPGIEGLVLADLCPSTSQLAAALQLVQGEHA